MRIAFVFAALLLAAPLAAQTALNPSMVEFDPSPDHNATKVDLATGQTVNVLTRYDLSWIAQNVTGAIAFTKQLGKPAPNTAGKIAVTIPELASIAVDTVFKATVTAVGPDGSTPSGASNPFGRPGPPKAPAAPGIAAVK